MTPAQSFKLRSLMANLINATVSGEPNSRQLAHEDHLRNYVTNLVEEKDAEIERLKAQLESVRALSNVGELFDGMDECNEDTHEENYKVLEGAMDRIYELVTNPQKDA
jgi:hypothetical protein